MKICKKRQKFHFIDLRKLVQMEGLWGPMITEEKEIKGNNKNMIAILERLAFRFVILFFSIFFLSC